MAAHGVSADGAATAESKLAGNQLRQLVAKVIVHAEMRGPRRLGGIEIKASAFPQIVSAIVGNVITARTGVRHHQRNAQFGGDALCARFGGEVFIIAGQAGEPVENRRRRVRVGGR